MATHRLWSWTWALVLAASGTPLLGQQPISTLLSIDERARHEAVYFRCGACRVPESVGAGREGLSTDEARSAWASAPRVGANAPPVNALAPGSLGGVAVMAGTVEAMEALATGNGRVYTAYRLRVDRVVRSGGRDTLRNGAAVVITRPGGTIPVGATTVDIEVAGWPRLALGAEVEVSVLPLFGTSTYQEIRLPAGALDRDGGVR